MAVYLENIVDIDLNSAKLYRTFYNNQVGEGDVKANRFGARLFRGEDAALLSGCSVVGYFIRSDGVTVTINGVVNGNEIYVELTDSCYVCEGNFKLTIKVIGGGISATVRIVEGTVIDTTTSAIVDPGGLVPDIDALMAVIERAEDAAETIAEFGVYASQISGSDYEIVITSPT